jgi:hypothetical protein
MGTPLSVPVFVYACILAAAAKVKFLLQRAQKKPDLFKIGLRKLLLAGRLIIPR